MRRKALLPSGVWLLATALCVVPASAQYSAYAPGGRLSGGGFAGGSGSYGAAAPGNLSLVIAQTQDVHPQVGGLLDQLRRANGQQVGVSTPFVTVGDSFFERIGINFGFSIPGSNINPNDPNASGVVGLNPDGSLSRNMNFRQGGFGSAQPPFGGADPNSFARSGLAVLGGEVGLFFNFELGQGSTRSLVSETPSVVLTNGFPGTISDSSLVPFVTGIIPVVGGYGPTPYALSPPVSPLVQRVERLRAGERGPAATVPTGRPHSPQANTVRNASTSSQSSADHGELSVAEIRRRRESQREAESDALHQEILTLLERARGAQQAGKTGAAKVYYRMALRRADGELKQQVIQEMRTLYDN